MYRSTHRINDLSQCSSFLESIVGIVENKMWMSYIYVKESFLLQFICMNHQFNGVGPAVLVLLNGEMF